ncbi:hypothetical protein IWQ61_000897 [Dispira simplex]|nr:hypothetical protein IWQ61_000897 [Dispira simplex]
MENRSYNASRYSWQQSDNENDQDNSDTGYDYSSTSSGYGEQYSNSSRRQDSDVLFHENSEYETTYDGCIRLPLTLETAKGTVTVHSLGIVYTREGFATAKHIFPVGYCSSVRFIDYREYIAYGSQSYIDYYSKIAEEEGQLIFEIYVGDDTYPTFTGPSASSVWGQLSVKLKECQHSGLTNVSGLLMMGLNDPRIIRAIQELPGAEASPEYQMKEIIY